MERHSSKKIVSQFNKCKAIHTALQSFVDISEQALLLRIKTDGLQKIFDLYNKRVYLQTGTHEAKYVLKAE